MASEAMDAALQALVAYLGTSISGLTVKSEWPYGNEQLSYPTLTVFQGKTKRTPIMPYQIACTTPDMNHKVVATEVTANVEAPFQLDLWCRDKLQRRQVLAQILAAFQAAELDATGDNNPDGLTLALASYFNTNARYEIDTYECVDDEAAAQRKERRERIMLLVNVDEISQRTYYAMVTIQTQLNTGSTDESWDASETETFDGAIQ